MVWATSSANHSSNLKRTFLEAARVLRERGTTGRLLRTSPSWPRYVLGKDFGEAEKELGINETWNPRSTFKISAHTQWRSNSLVSNPRSFGRLRRSEIYGRSTRFTMGVNDFK